MLLSEETQIAVNESEGASVEQTEVPMTKGSQTLTPRCLNRPNLPARSICELIGVVVTGLGFLLIDGVLHQKALFIGLAASGWLSYIGFCLYMERKKGLIRFGLRVDNLKAAMVIPSLIFGASLALMLIYAGFRHNFFINTNILILLVLYPPWGILQQMLIQTFFAANLWELFKYEKNTKYISITLLTAVVFGLVHLANIWLALGTFCLALVWTPHYLEMRNVIPLGLFHGWIGAWFYFLVLHRDPWQELVG